MLLNYGGFPAFSVAANTLATVKYISLYQQSDTIMYALKLVGLTPVDSVCCLVELPLSLF